MEEYIKYIKWLGMLIYKKELELLNENVNFIFGEKNRYVKGKEDTVLIISCNSLKETIYKIYKYIPKLRNDFKILDLSIFKGNDRENFSDTILISIYCVENKKYESNLKKYNDIFDNNIKEVDYIYKKATEIIGQEKQKLIEINDIPQNDLNIRINDLYRNMLKNLIKLNKQDLKLLKNNKKKCLNKNYCNEFEYDKISDSLFNDLVKVEHIDKFLKLADKKVIKGYCIKNKKYSRNNGISYKDLSKRSVIILDYPQKTNLQKCIEIINNKLDSDIIIISDKNNKDKNLVNVHFVNRVEEVYEIAKCFRILYISNNTKEFNFKNILNIQIDDIENISEESLVNKILQTDYNLSAFANLDHINSVKVLTGTFLDFDGTNYYSGGAERYLIDLHEVCKSIGTKLRIYQKANYNFFRYYEDIEVVGLTSNDEQYDYKYEQDMEILRQYYYIAKNKTKLNIYSSFMECHGKAVKPSIGISHGVAWDNRLNKYDRNNMNDKAWIIDSAMSCDKLVSVDTNTANYFQTVDYKLGNTTEVVPNYVDINEFIPDSNKKNNNITIVYPRRLYEPRGLYLLLDITDRLMQKYNNIEIHFVGKGFKQDTDKIQEKIEKWGKERIKMYSCAPQNMKDVYKNADISLIPTLYSEGTSLSCLEAMSAENAVIATRIGGLTDLIINKYNGILIEPNSESLFNAIQEYIDNPDLMVKCKKNAREVAKSFNKDIWIEKWKNLIKENALKKDSEDNVSYNIVKIYIKEEKLENLKLKRIILENLLKNNIVYIMTDRTIKDKSYGRLQYILDSQELYREAEIVLVDKGYEKKINEDKYEYIDI